VVSWFVENAIGLSSSSIDCCLHSSVTMNVKTLFDSFMLHHFMRCCSIRHKYSLKQVLFVDVRDDRSEINENTTIRLDNLWDAIKNSERDFHSDVVETFNEYFYPSDMRLMVIKQNSNCYYLKLVEVRTNSPTPINNVNRSRYVRRCELSSSNFSKTQIILLHGWLHRYVDRIFANVSLKPIVNDTLERYERFRGYVKNYSYKDFIKLYNDSVYVETTEFFADLSVGFTYFRDRVNRIDIS